MSNARCESKCLLSACTAGHQRVALGVMQYPILGFMKTEKNSLIVANPSTIQNNFGELCLVFKHGINAILIRYGSIAFAKNQPFAQQ